MAVKGEGADEGILKYVMRVASGQEVGLRIYMTALIFKAFSFSHIILSCT